MFNVACSHSHILVTSVKSRQPHLQVGSGWTKNSENVHDELLDDSLGRGRGLESYESIEDDQLDIVVTLLDDQLDVTLSCSANGWKRSLAKASNISQSLFHFDIHVDAPHIILE